MRPRGAGQLIAIPVIILTAVLTWRMWPQRTVNVQPTLEIPKSTSHVPCWNLPGANDTLVVLKTGATELPSKLPVHLETTTQCYPHYIVYSDYAEYFGNQHILDSLESVSTELQDTHPDFELYRRLKQDGRAALQDGAFEGGTSEISATGHAENPGWKLDKWKFLPMVNKTLHDYPDMKWYVFAEVDTYIVWATLLTYLAALDSTKPVYAGMSMYIGPDLFAHGGSGFIVSNPAMQRVVNYYGWHKTQLEDAVDHHWAGDCILGTAFRDSGVKFTNAWPIVQGDYPGWVTYDGPEGRDAIAKVWCTPVATYHHVSPEAVKGMWEVEQAWITVTANASRTDSFMRHGDVFSLYTLPRMAESPRDDWDNESDREELEVESFEECHRRCEMVERCLQYSYDEGGSMCKTRATPRLGVPKPGLRSGWMVERMESFRDGMPRCSSDVHWPT